MTRHDPFARPGRGRTRRRLRLPGLRRRPRLPGSRWPGPARPVRMSLRATVRGRRDLAAINGALVADAPQLASMFDMFNRLTRAERPVGVERLRGRGWPRPTSVQIALLAALAAIATLCIAASTQIHTVVRPCLASAASYAPVRDLGCQAYATNKQ